MPKTNSTKEKKHVKRKGRHLSIQKPIVLNASRNEAKTAVTTPKSDPR